MNNLQDYIKVYPNVVPLSLCDALCEEFGPSNEWSAAYVTNGKNEIIVDTEVRKVDAISLSVKEVIEKNKDLRTRFDKDVFTSVNHAVEQYVNQYPHSHIKGDCGYQILRYNVGEFYLQHTDALEGIQRVLSCSIGLNEDYTGGEFAFFDRQLIMRIPKGAAIVFPSNFLYPHEILPVLTGTRYSVVTWLA
jgi:hypothetical protein